MKYEDILAKQPASTSAGDLPCARQFVTLLTAIITGAGIKDLTEAQKNYLYKLRAKWELRATGGDAAWNTYGGSPGRRKRPMSERRKASIDVTMFGEEDERDPLLASIERKYGQHTKSD